MQLFQSLCWFGMVNTTWDYAGGELGARELSEEPEPKGQKYLSKDERKYQWDLAAGQGPAFFVRWPTAAGGACEVLIQYTQSRPSWLRRILGQAVNQQDSHL